MVKTLTLHIGHYKTGTTALQIWLAGNRAGFLEAGLDYPGLRLRQAKHSAFAFTLLWHAGVRRMMFGFGQRDVAEIPPEEMWEELFAHVRASPAAETLISSEEFIRIGEYPQATERLGAILARRGDIRLRAVVWLRPPGSQVEAWYNQLVKMGQPVAARPWAVARMHRVQINYRRALQPWARLVGRKNLIVRAYDPDWRGGDGLFRDMAAALGRPFDALPAPALRDRNPRLDDAALELTRILRRRGVAEDVIRTYAGRFEAWLAENPPKALPGEADRARLRKGARAGLRWAAKLPESNVDAAAWAGDLPDRLMEGDPMTAALAEFALAELAAKEDIKPGLAARLLPAGRRSTLRAAVARIRGR